jgi:hypothetical protein
VRRKLKYRSGDSKEANDGEKNGAANLLESTVSGLAGKQQTPNLLAEAGLKSVVDGRQRQEEQADHEEGRSARSG